MRPRRIELHIEELVLAGFPAAQRYAIGDALERELSRLIADRGLPSAMVPGGEIARLDAGDFAVAPGAHGNAIGAQVARAVYRGLEPPRK